ncbi:MAG: Hpt domain-containing protein [Rhodospirillaceae bacterium]|nr:Hpt domain-containing protein [Rhodospirillaceae bacterium]
MASRLTDGLAALRRDYAAKLDGTMAAIGRDWRAWREGDRDAGIRMRREIHRLYGSGATFGYRDITAVAGKLERLVDQALAGKELDVAAIGTGLERLSKVALKIELSGGRKPRSRTTDRDAVSGSRE